MKADDYRAIENLIAEYARRLDSGDIAGLGELFRYAKVRLTKDGDQISNDPQAITDAFTAWLQLYNGKPRTRHMMTNIQIWPEGNNQARATCYVMVFQQTDTLKLQPIIGGDYHDIFEQVDGTWRFAERNIGNDLIGDLSAHGRYVFPS